MAEFLGFAASAGMLSLIGCLIALFLKEAGALRARTVQTLLHCFLMAAGVGTAYFLTAALICHMSRQEIASPALISRIFSGQKTQRVFSALSEPAWTGPLSGPFVYIAHLLGKVLFGQYELAGLALAFTLTVIGLTLITVRLGALLGALAAKELSFLLLCLPGGVFFFLPGFMPLTLFLLAVTFFLLGKRIPAPEKRSRIPAYSLILTVSMVFSAFALSGAVGGWIG